MKTHLVTGLVSMLSAGSLFAYESYDLNWVNTKKLTLSSDNLATILNLEPDSSIRQMTQVKLNDKESLIRYTQEYKGSPIFSNHITAKIRNGSIEEVSGNVISKLDEIASFHEPDFAAPDRAVSEIMTRHYKNKSNYLNYISNQQIERWVYLNQDKSAQFVYIISWVYERDNQVSRPFKIVDATSLDEIDSWEGLTHQKNADGPGGNVKIGQYFYGSSYPSLSVDNNCNMKTTSVETWNMKNAQTGGTLFKFDCPTNTYKFTNGAYSPINDAHYMGNAIYDMYNAWFNIPALKQSLKIRVHYAENFENAFWDGQQISLGDGANDFYPLVAFDVIGHEVSHGFTEQHSGLIYKGQSGAINESFSDMAGEATEFFAKNTNDYLLGSDITKRLAAIRDMSDPKKYGGIDNVADYNDQTDVHYTSGIFNKAFYVLATSKGWGIRKAFEVFALANIAYWDSKATFESAAAGVCRAARDKSYKPLMVSKAFKSVGLKPCQI